MQRIVVPLDGSAHGETVLPYAVLLGRALPCTLTLIRVVAPAASARRWPEPAPLNVRQHWEREAWAEAHAYLQATGARLQHQGVDVQRAVAVADDVAATIVAHAQAPDVAMIAMTTHGRRGLGRRIFGSVAHKVLHGTPVPLLLGRAAHDTPPAPAALGTVLVPLDGSALAEQALPWAQRIAAATNAPLLLVSAVPAVDDRGLADGGVEPLWMLAEREAAGDAAAAYLDAVAQSLRTAGLTVNVQCVPGAPADAIIESSAHAGAHLIIMTTHGRTGWQRLWLGSMAYHVAHAATMAVLLVRIQASVLTKEGIL